MATPAPHTQFPRVSAAGAAVLDCGLQECSQKDDNILILKNNLAQGGGGGVIPSKFVVSVIKGASFVMADAMQFTAIPTEIKSYPGTIDWMRENATARSGSHRYCDHVESSACRNPRSTSREDWSMTKRPK